MIYYGGNYISKDNSDKYNIKIKQIINLPENIAIMEPISNMSNEIIYEDTSCIGDVGFIALTHVIDKSEFKIDDEYDVALPYIIDEGMHSNESAIRVESIFVPTASCPKCRNKMIVLPFKEEDRNNNHNYKVKIYCRLCNETHELPLFIDPENLYLFGSDE